MLIKQAYFFLTLTLLLSCLACSRKGQDYPTVAPTATTVTAPPVEPTPSPTPVAMDSPLNHSPLAVLETPALVRYRGVNPYGPDYPPFDIWYDPSQWQFVEGEDASSSPRLVAAGMPGCQIRLQTGPIGAESADSVQLAGREWRIAPVQPGLFYFTLDEAPGFMFDIFLPQEATDTVRAACQEAAERMIDTFEVVTE